MRARGSEEASVAFPDGLNTLVEDGIIDAVHSRLMSGKEAAVFVVEYRGALVAAKVYKSRERRTFKATSSYTEGRNQTRSTRDQRAMAKRSNYGRELVEETWREMEYRALFDAFHGGVRVPKPIMLYEDVLLMDLVLDEGDTPAPRLADFELAPEHAEAMFREIYEQARRLLATGRIHGDLSAFNILIAKDGPTIIDLPQVVDAAKNNQARNILRRDLANIAEHLAKYDARLLRFRDAGDVLFHHFQRGTLDQATEPQAGNVRRHDRPQGGRRAELAERGRMNRENNGRRRHSEEEHPAPNGPRAPNQERPRSNGSRMNHAPRADRTEENAKPARGRFERPAAPIVEVIRRRPR